MLCADCSSLAPSLMDRLSSSRFSISNRLARLSSNWGLPDALARLGLADPSAPLHPGPAQPSPIAEEAGAGQEANQAAMDQAGSGEQQPQQQQEDQQQQLQPQPQEQQAPDAYIKLDPRQSIAGGKRLQRQSAQQHKHLSASNEGKLLSEAALVEKGSSDVSGKGSDGGEGDADAAKQTAAGHTDPAHPVSSSSPAGRAAFASLGNIQSSPLQSEVQNLAWATFCRQSGITTRCMALAALTCTCQATILTGHVRKHMSGAAGTSTVLTVK